MNDIRDLLKVAGGYLAGVMSAVAVAGAFLMSPPDMLRWVFAAGSNEDKVSQALDFKGPNQTLHSKLLGVQSQLLGCRKELSDCIRPQRENVADHSCIRNLEGIRDNPVYGGGSTSFFGGRIHISVYPPFRGTGCSFFARSDFGSTELTRIRFGADVSVKTSAGLYRIIPTGNALALGIFPNGCTFDLLKVPAKED